jgi:SAM-dependent methyltransferase
LGEFVIPQQFNRNHAKVQALGAPALTGWVLLDYMTKRLGWESLTGKTVLDIGCGTRFTSAILTHEIPVGRYIGVDIHRGMIEWLQTNTARPNLEFHCVDQANPMYNPTGLIHQADWSFAHDVDLCCMFSVITHQLPLAASSLFREAHKRVKDAGFLFFSAAIRSEADENQQDYVELASNITGLSSYRETFLRKLLSETGWVVLTKGDPDPVVPQYPIAYVPIASHFVCQKAT